MLRAILSRRVAGTLGRWLLALGVAAGGGLAASATVGGQAENRVEGLHVLSVPPGPGPSLRAAVQAMERGDEVTANRLLSGVVSRYPLIADDAALLQAQLRMDLGRYYDVINSAARWRQASVPLRTRFLVLLGEALAALGDEERARTVWNSAVRATRDSDERAALLVSIAESHDRSGDPESAVDPYLRVWTRDPTSESDAIAVAGLDALERELGRTLRSGNDYRKRGDSLYRHRHNEDALAAYEHALGRDLSSREHRKVREARARTLFRLRRYTEAANAYAELSSTPERRIQRGRALARAGQVGDGIRELEDVGADTTGLVSARALLLAGLLLEGEGDFSSARKRFLSAAERASTSATARAARWRLGWEAYRDNRLAEAAEQFERLAREEEDPVAALRPRYWHIRILEQLGGEGQAGAAYAEIAREFPLSYYGWRASQRIHDSGSPRLPERVAEGSVRITSTDTALPRILLEAGLAERAREELQALGGRVRGVEDRLALAQLYADAGDFHSPQRLVVDAYTEQLARGPSPAQLELWWHAWPAPFDQEMEDAGIAGGGVTPELVYAVMREESGYRPRVRSVSGARGLLQIMPSTAEKLAAAAQVQPFAADDLFLPAVNIRLGTDYLSNLLERFSGRTSAVIGSYNAGPHVVARWLQGDRREDDVWVEEIPYNQTRGYVKRVLRSLHVYEVLY